MVEGGRLEIVLAVLSCHVGSNPTLSARKLNIDSMSTISCGELSERSMVNGWKPFAVMSRQRFKSSTLRHFYALLSAVTAISCSHLKSFLLLSSLTGIFLLHFVLCELLLILLLSLCFLPLLIRSCHEF